MLATIFARESELDFARELTAVVSVRYPTMVSSNPAADSPIMDKSSPGATAMQSVFGISPTSAAGPAPCKVSHSDFWIGELASTWWNKIASGAYMASADERGKYPVESRVFDACPRLVQYCEVIARTYAVTTQFIFAKEMCSANTWNGIFTNATNSAVLTHLRGYFSEGAAQAGGIVCSRWGEDVARIHSTINGCSCAADAHAMTVYDYVNMPQAGILPIHSWIGDLMLTPSPCILPDIHYNLSVVEMCLGMAPSWRPIMD